MQQAFFSPGPGSCPAWALPTVMTLVRALPCLCLDTLANTSAWAGGSGQVRGGLEPTLPRTHHVSLSESWGGGSRFQELLPEGSGVESLLLT